MAQDFYRPAALPVAQLAVTDSEGTSKHCTESRNNINCSYHLFTVVRLLRNGDSHLCQQCDQQHKAPILTHCEP